MTDHPVAVAYLHPDTVSHSFSWSILRLVLHEISRTGQPPLLIESYSGVDLAAGRNKVAASFLDDATQDWLLWIDSDMGFEPDALERLLKRADRHRRPVVGGLCFGLRHNGDDPDLQARSYLVQPTLYEWVEEDGTGGFRTIANYPRDSTALVGATGSAFVLVHRKALVKMRDEFGDNWYSHIDLMFDAGPRHFSEDMSFCIRCAAVDVPVYVDTRVRTSHHKGQFYLTEEVFDGQQATTAFALAKQASDREAAERKQRTTAYLDAQVQNIDADEVTA